MLTEDYEAADREILSPAFDFVSFYKENPTQVLRACFDLILGRVDAENLPGPAEIIGAGND